MVPLLYMMLNVVFGGKGVGLMNMIMYVILAVFICGLMIGRIPEYLGKKIEGREMKLTALCIIIHPLLFCRFLRRQLATGGLAGNYQSWFQACPRYCMSMLLLLLTTAPALKGWLITHCSGTSQPDW